MDSILVLWCSKCPKIFSDFKQHKSIIWGPEVSYRSYYGKIKVQTSLCSFMADHFVHYKNSASHGFKTGAFNFLLAISLKSPEAARGLSPVFAHWFLYLREQMGTHPSACQHDSAWEICAILETDMIALGLLGQSKILITGSYSWSHLQSPFCQNAIEYNHGFWGLGHKNH